MENALLRLIGMGMGGNNQNVFAPRPYGLERDIPAGDADAGIERQLPWLKEGEPIGDAYQQFQPNELPDHGGGIPPRNALMQLLMMGLNRHG